MIKTYDFKSRNFCLSMLSLRFLICIGELIFFEIMSFQEATQPADYLREMQCMWFETESANAYRRLQKYGESLKKCHQVERVWP